jgi:SAM-dependent methyltransferase
MNMTHPNFFNTGSPYLNHPLLTPERTACEIDFILSETNNSPEGRFLDVGCGPGRHSIELAQRGYTVVGIDPSATMIAAAKERASAAGVSPDFQQVAGEDFITDETFDAAICLFTTLGQIEDQKDNHPIIPRVAAALRPGGVFIVEVPQREWVASNLKPTDRFGEGDRYTDVTRQFDTDENSVTEIFTHVAPGETQRYILRYRLYSSDELSILLEKDGFDIVAKFGDFNGSPLTIASPVMVLVAQRKG